ncbi:MAG TPA: lysophospholipid acyltransferase family protein [Gemmatimonadaceae bacterium]|nr:lysophospholipid acyltransferase family protein [Gemmatimonadaceae bacterium]
MILVYLLATLSLTITAIIVTVFIGGSCVIAALCHVQDRAGSVYDLAPRWWSKIVLFMTGVRIRKHNYERAEIGKPHIFVSNHVSWYDIPALASILYRTKFVSKAELFKIPIFGPAMKAAGMIPVERQNRKAAFAAYDDAVKQIHDGNCVVVFPEGTRGYDYPLRPFKKGPFVLAIAAGVPIIPVLLHGTLEVIGKGSMLVHPGAVDVHFLEPVSVEGYDYERRDELAAVVRGRIAEALSRIYGIESEGQPVADASTAGI